jgi:tetratricopeptide (TPR) repeat protein
VGGDYDAPHMSTVPDSAQQVLKMAFTAHNAGRQAEAEALCRVLLGAIPNDPQLLFLLGMVLHRMKRDAEAVPWLKRAAELKPGLARNFSGLGLAFRGAGNEAEAMKNFSRAAALEPENGSHFYNLGLGWHQLNDPEQARAAFQKAVELNPGDVASWNNLGKIFKHLNRIDDSLAAYDRALAIAPEYELARHGRAILLLAAGRLGEGFREYESRWSKIRQREYPRPHWHGENRPGETIFLHAEQGFGDAIHFARFVPLARERAGRIILECRPELKSLFNASKLADEVVGFGENVPAFDRFTSIISLPRHLGINENNVSARVPYLQAPAAGDLPPAKPATLKVGIVWAGSAKHNDDAMRSISLEQFLPLLQTPGVTFYSLQQVVPERDKILVHELTDVIDLSPRLTDFSATAGLVNQLDLVIAVDTAVAHLAGALAKPVWTLVQFDADWRWFGDGEGTVWYPTMRLFRQTRRGDWPPVVARAADALKKMTTSEMTVSRKAAQISGQEVVFFADSQT